MYIKKECPQCHCSVDIDKETCPLCGYTFSSAMEDEEKTTGSANQSTTNFNFCPNCGTKLNAISNFCPNCGCSLSNNTNNFHEQKTYSNQNSEASNNQTYETDEYTVSGQFTIPPKSGFIAGLLAFFFGALGFHNLYLRRYGQGVVQLVTTIICSQLLNGRTRSASGLLFGLIGMVVIGIWAVADFFRICNGTLLPVGRMLRTKPWQETVLNIMKILVILGLIFIGVVFFSLIGEI